MINMAENMTKEEKYIDAMKKVDDLKAAYDELTPKQQKSLALYAVKIGLNRK